MGTLTHNSECWRTHHACAVAKIERLLAENADLKERFRDLRVGPRPTGGWPYEEAAEAAGGGMMSDLSERLRISAMHGTYDGTGECHATAIDVAEAADENERLRKELVSIHRAVVTLVSSCIDGQNELHGIKYGGPAKRTLRGIEGTLETIARKAAEAAGEGKCQ